MLIETNPLKWGIWRNTAARYVAKHADPKKASALEPRLPVNLPEQPGSLAWIDPSKLADHLPDLPGSVDFPKPPAPVQATSAPNTTEEIASMATTATLVPAPKQTFFQSFKHFFSKFFGKAPAWEAQAASTLNFVAPLAETAIALIDPAVAPEASVVIGEIQTGLAAAAAVIKQAGPAPTVLSYLDSVKANIQQLEAVVKVTNPQSAEKITAITDTIVGEIDAIAAEIGANK